MDFTMNIVLIDRIYEFRPNVVFVKVQKRDIFPEGILYDVIVKYVKGKLGDIENIWMEIKGGELDWGNFY